MKTSQPATPSSASRFAFFKQIYRWFAVILVFVLAAQILSGASASGFTVLLMSRSAADLPGDSQSDYASVAFGGDSVIAPYPPMVFSSMAANLLPDPNAYEAQGMVEGDGEPGEQQYDIFMRDEQTGEMRLLSRTHGEGEDGESVLATIGAADEELVVFQSSSTNLRSTPDTNFKTDIYLVNLNYPDDEPELVSRAYGSSQGGNNHSGNTLENGLTWVIEHGVYRQIADWHKPAFVYKGLVDLEERTLVLFESRASNLIAAGTSGRLNIFRRDVIGENTILISRNKYGEEGNGDSWQPTASVVQGEAGRYVVFVSNATNLADVDGDGDIDASDDTNNNPDVFMLDTYTLEVTLISRQWNCNTTTCTPGPQANGPSGFPSFSQDGRFIVFQSKADNLVAGDSNDSTDIFLYNRFNDLANDEKRLSLISKSSDFPGENPGDPDVPGEQGNLASYSPIVVSNVRPVGDKTAQIAVFTSYATNLIDGDTNEFCNYVIEGQVTHNCPDIFVHDFIRNQTWRVSLTYDGQEAQGSNGWPTLSGNGRFVYYTTITNLLNDGEYIGRRQVFLRDQGNPPGNPNLQPTSWNFGSVLVYDPHNPPSRRFRIVALEHITINNLYMASGQNFAVSENTCLIDNQPRLLNAGDECTFIVNFTPTDASGDLWDRVRIELHDTNPGMSDRTIEARVRGRGAFRRYMPQVVGR